MIFKPLKLVTVDESELQMEFDAGKCLLWLISAEPTPKKETMPTPKQETIPTPRESTFGTDMMLTEEHEEDEQELEIAQYRTESFTLLEQTKEVRPASILSLDE